MANPCIVNNYPALAARHEELVKQGMSDRDAAIKAATEEHKVLYNELNKFKKSIGVANDEYTPFDASKKIQEVHDKYNPLIENIKNDARINADKPLPTTNTQSQEQGIESGIPKSTDATGQTEPITTTPILKNEETNNITKPEAQASITDQTANSNIDQTSETTGNGGKEPPIVNVNSGTPDSGNDWSAIRKEKQREIKAVQESYDNQKVKGWSETMKIGLEKTQAAHPDKILYDAALTTMHNIKAGLGHGDMSTDEALATMSYLKREIGAKRAKLSSAVTSDNSLIRDAALFQDEGFDKDYTNTALAIKDITTTAGRTLNFAQSEIRLDPEHGLQIRRMQFMKAKGGEALAPEEMQWTKDKWAEEQDIAKREAILREEKMKEDFDNRVADMQKEYEDKLKEAGKNTPQNRTNKTRTLSQSGKDIADQIRKLKIQKGDLALDVTFGLRNLAIEAVAQIVEKGSTIAEAIKKVLEDVKYKGLTEDELSNHIIDGLNNKKIKSDQVEKIKDFIKENPSNDITSDMVSKNLIRDYVNSHIGEVEKSKILDTAFDDLKKILPEVTKEKLTEAYLKEGEFKQDTKKQIEGGIKEQENELKKIAKSQLTADQQQKIKLGLEKKNVENKIKEFKRKIADNDFEESKPPTKLNKKDAGLIELEKQKNLIEDAYREKQREVQKKETHPAMRALYFARNVYVATLIGMPKTLLKVGSSAILRSAQEGLRRATLGKIFNTYFPGISKVALRGGESSSWRSLKTGYEAYFRQYSPEQLELKYDNANKDFESARQKYIDFKNSNPANEKQILALKNKMDDALIKVQGSFIYKFMGGSSLKDALSALTNRANEIEKQFGHEATESIKNGDWLDKTDYIIGLVGRSHSALKTFSGRFSFAAGFMARLEGAVANGEDISSNSKIIEIAHESYLDWQRGKYQQSNMISDWWSKLVNSSDKDKTGLALALSTTAKLIAKTDVAITRVPINMFHESLEYTFGAFRVLGILDKFGVKDQASIPRLMKESKLAISKDGFTNGTKEIEGVTYGTSKEEFKNALREQINKMDEKQAAIISRCFSKGGIGIGLYAFALISGAIHFGIFPHLGQKKKKEEKDLKPGELNPGQVMLGDTRYGEIVSSIMEHNTAASTMFMGLGLSQAYNDEINKGKTTAQAVGTALYTHLKIWESDIPQTKILSPTKAVEGIIQLVKKRATDTGIIEPDAYKGFSKTQIESEDFKYVKENGLKLKPPPPRQADPNKPNFEKEDEYNNFIKLRADIISNDLKQLRQKGLENGATDENSLQEEVEKITEKANERAKKGAITKEQKVPKEPNGIKDYEQLEVAPKE